MKNTYMKKLKIYRGRIYIRRLLKNQVNALAIAIMLCIAIEIVSKLIPISSLDLMQKSAVGLTFAIALIYTIIKRPTMIEAAENADYDGLDEIVQTTYEYVFLSKEYDKELADKMLSKSILAIDGTNGKHNTGILPDKRKMGALLVLIAVLIGSKFIKTDLSRSVIAEQTEIKKIDKLTEEVKKEIEDIKNQEILEEFKKLQKALKDVHNTDEIDKELFKNREKLTENIKKDIEKALNENKLSMLSESEKNKLTESSNPINTIKDLMKSSKANNNNTLSKELSDLMDEINDDGGEEISEALEKLEEIEEKISEHNGTADQRGGT